MKKILFLIVGLLTLTATAQVTEVNKLQILELPTAGVNDTLVAFDSSGTIVNTKKTVTDLLIDKTSDILNDGENGIDSFLDVNDLNDISKEGLSIQDGSGFEFFKTEDFLKFSGFEIDLNNKELKAPVGSYNTILRGAGSLFPTKQSWANNITRVFGNRSQGGPLSGIQVDQWILDYRVLDGDVYCTMAKDYNIGNPVALRSILTEFLDYEGRMVMPANFSNYTVLKELYLPKSLSVTISNNPELDYLYIPLVRTMGNISNVPKLKISDGYLRDVVTLGNLGGTTVVPTVIDRNVFPNLQNFTSQDWFSGKNVTSVVLPSLVRINGNLFRFASTVTSLFAPNVEDVDTQSFFGANALTVLDFPKAVTVGDGNGINTFTASGLKKINIPKCVIMGATTGDDNVFGTTYTDLVIYANDFLRTNNNGSMEGDLQDAISRGARVVFVSDEAPITSNVLGWAQYGSSQYTSSSPLTVTVGNTVTVDIDGLSSTVKSQMPIDAINGELYDVSTSKITPISSGDGYSISIEFKGTSNSNNGSATIGIDIGGSFGQIFKKNFRFPRGTGVIHDFYLTSQGYSLGTFLANGGIIKLTSDTGTTEIHDITIQIHRTHKAR